MRTIRMSILATCLLASGNAHAGTQYTEVDAAGATLRIRFSVAVNDEQASKVSTWLQSVAGDVGGVYGRFPLDDVDIRVIPRRFSEWDEDSPVPFGRVSRRRGETIVLYIDPRRPMADFYADWTATHEMSHLLLPGISWKQRWIAEGFASYYQNVLMARSGNYTTDTAIRKLNEGFGRGRASRPELSPNQAAEEGVRRARYKIYWSGAAVALLADVQLREQSGGRESLDTVLGRFQDCCLPARDRWTGEQLFEKLDSLSSQRVFMPLYRRYADAPGFPDVQDALASPYVRNDIFAVRNSTD